MNYISIYDDLYRYNSWANERIFALCEGLSDQQLDAPREMGFGSLRNTLFHILVSEEIWLERWNCVPWRTFPMEAQGISLGAMAARLGQAAENRQLLLDRERPESWRAVCHYKDSKGNPYHNPLQDLMLHVANHGIHHRAQALNFLKRNQRVVPGGLDYIFFRFAKPHLRQEPATVESMRKFGMEVESGSSPAVAWDASTIHDYFTYGDWANERLLRLAATLDDAALDRSWDMGLDTIRKTALHLADAERWWLRNWKIGPSAFDKAPLTTSIAELQNQWSDNIAERTRFLATLDAETSQRIVGALVGPMSFRIPVIESLVQLCGHGTHHRAQLINMLRHSGVTPPGCDYILWLRDNPKRYGAA